MPQTSAAMMGYGLSASNSASTTLENISSTVQTPSSVMTSHHSLFANLAAVANNNAAVLCQPSTSTDLSIPTGNFNYDPFITHSLIDTTNSTLCHSNTTTSSSSGCSTTPQHSTLPSTLAQIDSDIIIRNTSMPNSPNIRTTTSPQNHDSLKVRQPLLTIPAFFNSQVIKPLNQNNQTDILDNCNQDVSNITELSSASSSSDSSSSFCLGINNNNNNNANNMIDAASTAAMLAAAAAAGQQRSYWMQPPQQMMNSVTSVSTNQQPNQYGYNPQQFPLLFQSATTSNSINSINDWNMMNMSTPIHATQINSQNYNYLLGSGINEHQAQSQQQLFLQQQPLVESNEQLLQQQHQLQLQHQQQQQ